LLGGMVDMKIFYLLYNDQTVPVAICKDKWLLELFIAQRKLDPKKCDIKKSKSKEYLYNDRYLTYYYGHAITNIEARYIYHNTLEAESDVSLRIHDLEAMISGYKNELSAKKIKQLKSILKAFKKLNIPTSKKFAKRMLTDIIDQPKLITEYLEAIDLFRQCIDHDYLH
jgi:hypothetical protein